MKQILQRKTFEMKKRRIEQLIITILVLLFLTMGSGLLVSCGTTKQVKYIDDLPSEFTHKCGDCRDLK